MSKKRVAQAIGIMAFPLAVALAILLLPGDVGCLSFDCGDFRGGGFFHSGLTAAQATIMALGLLVSLVTVGLSLFMRKG